MKDLLKKLVDGSSLYIDLDKKKNISACLYVLDCEVGTSVYFDGIYEITISIKTGAEFAHCKVWTHKKTKEFDFKPTKNVHIEFFEDLFDSKQLVRIIHDYFNEYKLDRIEEFITNHYDYLS